MTWEGPDLSEITMDMNACWALWCGGGGTVRMERIDTSLWNQTIKCSPEYQTYPGTGTKFAAIDCVIGYRSSSGILHIAGTDAEKDSCDFIRCTFVYDDDGMPTIPGPGSNGEYPCTYVNTGVAFSADSCWFKKSGHGTKGELPTAASYGWLHYGGGYFQTQNLAAKYARVVNCLFDAGLENQLYSASGVETQVSGCVFKTVLGQIAVEPQGSIFLIGCQFVGEGSAGYGIYDSAQADVAVTAIGCQFGRLGQGDGYVYAARRMISGSKEWKFIGCEFNDINSAGIQLGFGSDSKNVVQDCTFQGSSGVYAISVARGHVLVNDCRFKSLPSYVDGNDGDCTIELNRNRWDLSAQWQVNNGLNRAINIRGAENQFYEGIPGFGEGFALVGGANLSGITGDIGCRPGIGSYIYDPLHDPNVLTVNLNHDTYEVDAAGTPAINTINMSGGFGGGAVPSDLNRFHQARIVLLAKQAFSLGSSGNIVARAGARLANSLVTLQWIPSASKWYEISGVPLADASTDGLMSTGNQTIAGAKTFLGKACFASGVGVGNSASATILGTVVKKIEVFDASGNSIGYIAVYDAIT